MLPCLSTKLSKEYINERIKSIVRCATCHRGFFVQSSCPYCVVRKKVKPLKIVEHINIHLFYPIKKKPIKVAKKRVDNKCTVCGEPSGKRMCCSDLCNVRNGSAFYLNNGKEYMSIESARVRLDGIIERKRLRELSKNS